MITSKEKILAAEMLKLAEEVFSNHSCNDVNKDLLNWGVVAIKNIELMDIRDAKDSKVIHQIMAKQMSAIESESRIAVSNNKKTATEAELENEKEVNLKTAQTRQLSEKATAEADQAIGIAQAESKKMSGIADQKSLAEVAEAKKATTEKEMEVMRIKQITQAEITKKSAEILAEQNKRTAAITAESNKLVVETNAEATLLANQKIAEGNLILKQKEAEGIKATGFADAEIIAARGASESEAKKLMELASVVAQTTFAKEVGENKPYQEYLVELKKIDATAQVEIKRAESLAIALNKANLKLLVNSGDVSSGLNKFSDLFSSKGASQFNGILETLEQTEGGTKLVEMLKGFLGSKTKALNS
jgi:flotillin